MTKATATVPTENGWKYVQQLCKHWAHKLDVDVTESAQKGVVIFAEATAVMTSTSDALTVELDANSEEVLERMKGVVSSHLDRFAFREAPLPFDWKAVA
ncbi:DUF2218 domain-containing protein [Rhizobium halophytocola]|uniref:DUF2218 domain-containing protein n=1 Tax=Rhizobium halophytocola TaxID=735519 RepID=A0ABS4E3D0_9HYPH|nr:DUF2218 domain-containing protein [Rhizobium halophytocola]MBP1852437.1 hypothetical protein [Rhizobium halophytocola]